MRIGKYLLIGGGVYLLYKLFAKKSALDKLTFDIVSINAAGLTGTPTVDLNVRIRNISAESLAVNSIAGQLVLNGTFIGDAVASLGNQIPAFSDTVVTIKVYLRSSGLLTSVLSFLDSFQKPRANFQFLGTVNFTGVNFPLSLAYNTGL